jgi:hypothetical protein
MSSSKMFMYRIMYASLHVSSSSYVYVPYHVRLTTYYTYNTLRLTTYYTYNTLARVPENAYLVPYDPSSMPRTAYLYAPLRLPLWQIRRIHVIWGGGCTSYEEEDTGHGYLYDP